MLNNHHTLFFELPKDQKLILISTISMVHLFSLVTTKTAQEHLLPIGIIWWWEFGSSPFTIIFIRLESRQKPLGKHGEKDPVYARGLSSQLAAGVLRNTKSQWMPTDKHHFLKTRGPSFLLGLRNSFLTNRSCSLPLPSEEASHPTMHIPHLRRERRKREIRCCKFPPPSANSPSWASAYGEAVNSSSGCCTTPLLPWDQLHRL